MSDGKESPSTAGLSRRTRQILEVVYRLERATAAEIQQALPDPPSYSAVRTHLRILEERGHLTHVSEGPRYVYTPKVPRERASRGAIRHLVDTFFEGSVAHAVAALLDTSSSKLSPEDVEHLKVLIEDARKESASRSQDAAARPARSRRGASKRKGEGK